MNAAPQSRHRKLLVPLLILLGSIGLCGYSTLAALSADPWWFRGGAALPDPARIVVRVDGAESVLEPASPGYDAIVAAARRALSAFDNLSPRSLGLSAATLEEYQQRGVILELYCDAPVDFYLPFDDGQPTALLIPIAGRHAGHGYVFRGRAGAWWAGQMVMRDPQPLLDALSTLGYLQP